MRWIYAIALACVVGCAPMPGGQVDVLPPPPADASPEYLAGRKAAAELVRGYAAAIDSVGQKIDAGDDDATSLFRAMESDTAAARKRAIEPLEEQLDKSVPPDGPLAAKPWRDAARGFREGVQ